MVNDWGDAVGICQSSLCTGIFYELVQPVLDRCRHSTWPLFGCYPQSWMRLCRSRCATSPSSFHSFKPTYQSTYHQFIHLSLHTNRYIRSLSKLGPKGEHSFRVWIVVSCAALLVQFVRAIFFMTNLVRAGQVIRLGWLVYVGVPGRERGWGLFMCLSGR